MLKKVLAAVLSAAMIMGIPAGTCLAEEQSAETAGAVMVNTVYGDVEVPYAPERICVLDLSVMDIVDALGLGDQVVVLQWHKHYPDYLESYYNSETILSLTNGNNGHGGSAAEEDTDADPYEMYYSIDADIIIGTTEKITEDLYAVLSQIAPTVVLDQALESSEPIYETVRENAETVASIWGMEAELEEKLASYDEVYAQLCEAVNGKTYIMANGNTDLGLIQIGAGNYYQNQSTNSSEQGEKADGSEKKEISEKADASGKSKKKNNTANISAFLTQLGMQDCSAEVAASASAEEIAAAVEAGTSKEDAAAASVEAMNAVNPDAVFVLNYSYGSLEKIQEAGFDLVGLDGFTCPVGFVSIELSYTSGGLTAVTSMLDQMAELFLA